MKTKAPFVVKDLVMMDMRYPGYGPSIPPGKYELIVQQGNKKVSKPFELKLDPNWEKSKPDYAKQYALAKDIANLIDKSQGELQHLRDLRATFKTIQAQKGVGKELKDELADLSKKAKNLEDMIFQDKIKSSQDEINYERRFCNHIVRLYRVVVGQHGEPTAGEYERWKDVQKGYTPFEKGYTNFVTNDIYKLKSKIKLLNLETLPSITKK